jgi:hypothetical protein
MGRDHGRPAAERLTWLSSRLLTGCHARRAPAETAGRAVQASFRPWNGSGRISGPSQASGGWWAMTQAGSGPLGASQGREIADRAAGPQGFRAR